MKQALLFLVILIAFFGCRKAEKKIPEPKKVHEINMGILDSDYYTTPRVYYFIKFASIDLLNDSITVKYGTPNSIHNNKDSIVAGQFNSKNNSIISKFIEVALLTENGTRFLSPLDSTNLCKPNVFPIIYRSDSIIKYFFYQEGNKAFEDFIKFVGQAVDQKRLRPVYYKTNLKDDTIVQFLMNLPNFRTLPLRIPICQMTIKFTPPVKEKKPKQ